MIRVLATLRAALAVLLALSGLTGCSGGKSSSIILDDTSDSSAVDLLDGTTLVDATSPEFVTPDALIPPEVDAISVPDEVALLGSPGDPCGDAAECASGTCEFGECVALCGEGCPAGHLCAAGVGGTEFCIPATLTQCTPCATDDDCQPAGLDLGQEGYQASCISYGVEGAYCASPCDADGGCQAGYECVEAMSLDGVSGAVCKRLTGVCPCSQYAIVAGTATPCPVGNEFGTCPGEKSCTEEGLSQCAGEPAKAEVCDGLDNDCDGAVDEGIDAGACVVENDVGTCAGTLECLSGEAVCNALTPVAEICDKLDNDCDGDIDEDFADDNGNGILDCLEGDTDDDGLLDYDDNCYSVANPDQANFDTDDLGDVCDNDDDNDGVNDTSDCAPFDAAISPKAQELCNGIDDDCDGDTDEGYPDSNNDGTADCMEPDTDGDGVFDDQDNCPILANPSQQDFDKDGKGDVCDPDDDNDGTEDLSDCAPLNAAINPDMPEVCNGIDDDCSGDVDEESTDCTTYYLDADQDGYGIEEVVCQCSPVDTYSALMGGDCNDADGTINPGAIELCADAIDNDCDPQSTCSAAQIGGEEVTIDTYKGEVPVAAFFSYGDPDNASFNTGLELSDTIVVMLYREPDGQTYLAAIVDQAGDGSGGSAKAEFSGLFGASLVVSDDPNEATQVDLATGTASASWSWAGCCTDGVIYGPLGCDGNGFEVTVNFGSLAGIDQVVVYDGLGGTITIADPSEPLVLTGMVDPEPVAPDQALASCKAILDAGESVGSGIYWVDPDGELGDAPFQVLCDMETNGGGWTLCGKFDRDNPWGLGSLPVGFARTSIAPKTLTRVGGFCGQGSSIDCRSFIAPGATQVLSAGTDSEDALSWAAGRIIDLPAEVTDDATHLWDVTLDEAGEGSCVADAVITRDLDGVDLEFNDQGANLVERAAILGDGAFFTNADRNGASFSNAGYATGVNACYGTGHDTVYWAWPDAAGKEDDHACGGNAGLLQLGNGCGQASGWAGKPTYRYNLMLVR